MTIAVLIIFRSGTRVYGAQRRLMKIIQMLKKRRFFFAIIEDYPPLFSYITDLNVTIRILHSQHLIMMFIWIMKCIIKSLNVIRILNNNKIKINFILVPVEDVYSFIPALILSKLLRIPVIITIHSLPRYYTEMKVRIFSCASQCITVSKYIACQLKRYGISSFKLTVSTNGIDYETLSKIKVAKEGGPEAIFIGRVSVIKGVYDLVRAWIYVNKILPTVKLGIVGDGDINGLLHFIHYLKLSDNIKVYGWKPYREAISLLKASKVLILPSYIEGLPFVILDALACNKEVVCYDLPQQRENFNSCPYIHFVPLRNIRKLADSIVATLKSNDKMSKDHSYIRCLSPFSWQRALYYDLLGFLKALKIMRKCKLSEK